MHGGIFEWTDSPWGRGAKDTLGVLRGGNGPSGELYGRCANAMGKPLTSKGATMGFRCCAGPRNDAKVDLKTVHGQTFSGTKVSALPAAVRDMPCNKDLDTPCDHEHAWIWQPIANVEIFVKGGCVGEKVTARCGMILAVLRGDEARVLAHVDAGREIPEAVLMAGDGRRIRIRGHDTKPFFREVTYNFGRLDVAVSK
jgi:formylglycine-generating enzyme